MVFMLGSTECYGLVCVCVCVCARARARACVHVRGMTVLVAKSCLTLYDHIDCSQPGSSVHGIL